jgi:glycosyltransferase involved in cell wall biosynthesis
MLRFYNAIDVLVMTSLSECMPRVVLEACACGIPVVCTDVGSIRMILDSDWIVPVNPEKLVVDEMNKRLHALENKDLRQRVGFENRQRVEKTLSWRVLSPYWDSAFIAAVERNISNINTINRHFGMA